LEEYRTRYITNVQHAYKIAQTWKEDDYLLMAEVDVVLIGPDGVYLNLVHCWLDAGVCQDVLQTYRSSAYHPLPSQWLSSFASMASAMQGTRLSQNLPESFWQQVIRAQGTELDRKAALHMDGGLLSLHFSIHRGTLP
jgi:hypothetical protein